MNWFRVFAAFGVSCVWLLATFFTFAVMANVYTYPDQPPQWIESFLYLSFAWPRSIFDRLFSPADCVGSYETLDGCSDPALVDLATAITLLLTYTAFFYVLLTLVSRRFVRGGSSDNSV
jgi:hypothetical protein